MKIKTINNEQLENIKGGATTAFSVWTGVVIASIDIFLSESIEGKTNPERCNE